MEALAKENSLRKWEWKAVVTLWLNSMNIFKYIVRLQARTEDTKIDQSFMKGENKK